MILLVWSLICDMTNKTYSWCSQSRDWYSCPHSPIVHAGDVVSLGDHEVPPVNHPVSCSEPCPDPTTIKTAKMCRLSRVVIDWLQTFSLIDLYHHHNTQKPRLQRWDSSAHLTKYRGSMMEEDRRLPMFGWNLETLNMLVLSMVLNKSVLDMFSCIWTYK